MFKKLLSNSPIFFLALCFVLIPVADMRIFAALPLYCLDGALVLFLGSVLWSKPSFLREFLKTEKLLFIGGLLLFVTVSVLANSPSLTMAGLFKSWFLLPMLAFSYYFYTECANKEAPKVFMGAWLVGLLTLLLLTLYWSVEGFYTFDGRLVGTFKSPNFLGYFLFPGALLSYYFFRQYQKYWTSLLLIATIPLFVIMLLLTQSLGALLALLAATLMYVSPQVFKRLPVTKLIRPVFCLLLILLLLTPLFFVGSEQRVERFTGERSSLSSRVMIWTSAGHIVVESPVLGIGLGNFQKVYLEYQDHFPPYLEWAVPQPHNFFLALWLQCGLFGLGIFIYMLWGIAQSLSQSVLTEERLLLLALLVGSLVYGIFDTPLFGNGLAVVWWGNFLALSFCSQQETSSTPYSSIL
jgi:O-antigen ligase